MTNANEPKNVVKNWIGSKSTIAFLGLWEEINKTSFKGRRIRFLYVLSWYQYLYLLQPTSRPKFINGRPVIKSYF